MNKEGNSEALGPWQPPIRNPGPHKDGSGLKKGKRAQRKAPHREPSWILAQSIGEMTDPGLRPWRPEHRPPRTGDSATAPECPPEGAGSRGIGERVATVSRGAVGVVLGVCPLHSKGPWA